MVIRFPASSRYARLVETSSRPSEAAARLVMQFIRISKFIEDRILGEIQITRSTSTSSYLRHPNHNSALRYRRRWRRPHHRAFLSNRSDCRPGLGAIQYFQRVDLVLHPRFQWGLRRNSPMVSAQEKFTTVVRRFSFISVESQEPDSFYHISWATGVNPPRAPYDWLQAYDGGGRVSGAMGLHLLTTPNLQGTDFQAPPASRRKICASDPKRDKLCHRRRWGRPFCRSHSPNKSDPSSCLGEIQTMDYARLCVRISDR